jgi:tRNA uridine 5-carbamoylmethylation protein Kti12
LSKTVSSNATAGEKLKHKPKAPAGKAVTEKHKAKKTDVIKLKEGKKTTKVIKKAVPIATNWMKALRLYKSAAGKEKTLQWAYNSLNFIQTSFNAKSVASSTPHIELIRKIQKHFVSAINNNLNKEKLVIDVDSALLEDIKEALSTIKTNKELPKPKVSDVDLNGIVNSHDVAHARFEHIALTGKWRKMIGEPSAPFHIMFYGMPGSGKSTIAIQFAHYLASEGFNVLYVAKEEGISKTIQTKIRSLDAMHKNLDISENPKNLHKYDVVFFDSINELQMKSEDLRKIQKKYPALSTVSILKATKQGKYLGESDFAHIVQAEFKCENGFCKAEKNRFGGNDAVNIF